MCTGLVPGIKGGQVADAGPALRGVDVPVGTQMQRPCQEDLDGKDKGGAVRPSPQRGFSEPGQCWGLPEAVTLKLRPQE